MKSIVIVSLLLLAACGNRPTLEQLEDEALVSGDWSKVEARERDDLHDQRQSAVRCPSGQIASCKTHLSPDNCRCVRSDGQYRLPIAE